MTTVHQFVPMLHRADAVGRHACSLRAALARRGIRSDIYVELTDPETAEETRPFRIYEEAASPGDLLVYQFATASGIAPWLADRRERLVVNYHSVTPAEHYAAWEDGLTRHQRRAHAQLQLLAPRTTLGLAVSCFDEAELRQAGYARTAVVPPAGALPASGRPHGPPRTTGARWICVGRLAPNKAVQHAIAGLLVARAHHDPAATLEVIGRAVVPTYTRALRRYADELGLRGVVAFRGVLSDEEMAAALATADVLVATSDHEGFGMPVVEAMAAGVPVVANRAGALPEVLGDAGVLVEARDPYALAGAVAQVLGRDDTARAAAGETVRRRLDRLDLPSAADRAVELLTAL